jgi:NADH:ubiquinone oxidoreductase subunit E/ferredoxin/NAD-dependent dihydropyrimidine dehydrogenase PreA subunit
MDTIKIRIDGLEIAGQKGSTILEASEKAGIQIPTLCYHPNLLPSGSCRICVVEVEGSSRLIGSCHTPIEPGMVIRTGSSKVLAARRGTLELLLAGHTGPCVNDCKALHCDLHNLASNLQAGTPRFRMRKPRNYSLEEANPYVRRDMSKCILCLRCISACRDLAKKSLFSTAYRGFRAKVVVDFDGPLDKEMCRDCLLCIDYCPTSALSRTAPMEANAAQRIQPPLPLQMQIQDRQRANLLPVLNKAQGNLRCVSQGVVTDAAQSMNLSISDVYGVATFYSYLSTRPTGEFVIRVCKSIPCCMANSQAIVQSLEEQLGLKPGETTADGLFSLELVNCIGACDQSPAMLVNDEVHGKLTPKKISKILKSCRSESRPGGE